MKITSFSKHKLPIVSGQHRWLRYPDGTILVNIDSVPNLKNSFITMQEMDSYLDHLEVLYKDEMDDVVDVRV
jgi:hypothetical protein